MSASHTTTTATAATPSERPRLTILPGVGLVDLNDPKLTQELAERLAGKVGEELVLFAARMREGRLAASVAIGLEVMAELMEAEVTELAGPKGKHNTVDRRAYRHGGEDGTVVLGGRKLGVRRPRVRGVEGGEVHLESYDALAAVDLLRQHPVAAMLAGVSTRRYPVALEPVGAEVATQARATTRSSVSRRFVAATAERLAEFRSRDLSDRRWLVIFVDGFDFAGHTMVGALGVTADGTKVPLGVVEGSTENATVCTKLVSDLEDRGLDASEGLLFVIDGGKAIRKAVRDVFGAKALVQRCRLHKERALLDYLPEAERPWVARKLRAAWNNPDAEEAIGDLRALAGRLRRINPDAAGSLLEGLEEMFTVTRLGVTGTLLRTLISTNPVESMIEIVRHRCRNVKRWKDGDMRLRWAAAGTDTAAGQFRRVKGYRQLPPLAAALRAATADDTMGLTRFDGHPRSGAKPRRGCPQWRRWDERSARVGPSPASSRPRSSSWSARTATRQRAWPATSI
jgi:putative transposase